MEVTSRKSSLDQPDNCSSEQRLISETTQRTQLEDATPHLVNGADPTNALLLSAIPLKGATVGATPLKPYLHTPPPILTLNGDARKSLTEKYYKPTFGKFNGAIGPGGGQPGVEQQHRSAVVFQGVTSGHKLPPKLPSESTSRITFLEMLRSSKKCLISFILCIMLIVVLLLTAILTQNRPAVCDSHICWNEVHRIEDSINRNVSACEDFYEFVCGKWMMNTAIPEHKPQETRFDQLQDKVKEEVKELIERSSAGQNESQFVGKMKRFYKSCMNLTSINKLGDSPLRRVIHQLGDWPVLTANWTEENVTLVEMHRRLRQKGLLDDMLLSITIVPSDKNNSQNILGISQPSFGLLDRDFMVRDLLNDTTLQRYYRLMLYTIKLLSDKQFYEEQKKSPHFEFFEYDDEKIDDDFYLDDSVKVDMLDALIFEQQLANNSLKKEDNRNLTLLFNNMTIAELETMSPNFPWLDIINVLSESNLTKSEDIIVFDINYVKFLNTIISNTSIRTLSNYLVWRVVKTKIGALDSVYQTLREQYNAASLGNAKPEPRWMQCVAQVQMNLGTALSNVYVKNRLTTADKEVINNIVLEIKEEFYQTLKSTEWMDLETKGNAIDKLTAMEFRVGFPDEILVDDLIEEYYKELKLSEDNYFENILAIGRFSVDSVFEELREVNSRDDWRKFSEVVDVNAYYFHQENTFILNAGLLQGIFFNPHRPNYLNYGAIGEVVGHEISHGFDGFGKQFDREGQLKNWWNHATSKMFESKASCIVEQYNRYYCPEVDMHLNGVNTQDENIADNGGVGLAYRAYKRAYAYKSVEPVLPALNFTREQLFWIGYGIGNCEKTSTEMTRLNIQVDSHSPSRFRLNGVVSNSYEFANDFQCPPGSPMNPTLKCKVW